jgi:hypothetical protein
MGASSEHIYVQDTEPVEPEFIWIDTSTDPSTPAGSNVVADQIKSYINTNIKNPMDALNTEIVTARGTYSNLDERLDSQSNDIASLSKPNLLINDCFQIWQRGTGTFTANTVYCADRWLKSYGTVDKTASGLKLTGAQDNWNLIRQYIEDYSYLSKQTLTLSCKVKYITNCTKIDLCWYDGATWNNKSFTSKLLGNSDILEFTFTPNLDSASKFAVGLILYNLNEVLEINWMKLEVGSKATPFMPRKYAEELALCQKYYQSNEITSFWLMAHATSYGNYFIITMPISVAMRTKPTVINNSSGAIQYYNGGWQDL